MKKWIKIMAAFVVATGLLGTMVGCGDAAPPQGESPKVGEEDMEKNMDDVGKEAEANKEGQGKKKGGAGGGATPEGGGGGATPEGGGAPEGTP